MEKWKNEEIEILKNNYEKNGLDFVKKLLTNRTRNSIVFKLKKLELKVDIALKGKRISEYKMNNPKLFNEFKVNPDQFLSINKKEISYVLGFLWADGYLRKDIISMWLKREDGENIKNVFEKIGNWNNYYRKLNNSKEQICFHTSNRFIYNFLMENDYKNKSWINQEKILSLIPDNMKHYFFRGYFDGDGTIWGNNRQSILNMTSSYEQDWTTLEKLMKELDINSSISRIESMNKKDNKINRCSRIVIQNMGGIIKFCNYIYKDFEFDNIGLKRKYDIFLGINKKMNMKIEKNLKNLSNNVCGHCGSKKIVSRGIYKKNKKRFYCKTCSRSFIGNL